MHMELSKTSAKLVYHVCSLHAGFLLLIGPFPVQLVTQQQKSAGDVAQIQILRLTEFLQKKGGALPFVVSGLPRRIARASLVWELCDHD